MNLAWNGATALLGSLMDDVAAAAAAGYQGLELWLPKVNAHLEQQPLTELAPRLAESGLKLLTLNSLERYNLLDPAGAQRMLVDAERLCRLARALGVRSVLVVPGPRPAGLSDDQVIEDSVRSLRILADLAERYEIGLGLEFLGFADCSINTLKDALTVTRAVGRSHVGVVIDTFHFYVGNSDLADIRTMQADELTIFHLNDCEPGPRHELTDDKRVYPGLGVMPLPGIVKAVRDIGYAGCASIEIFRPEYWAQPSLAVAAAAKTHAEQVLNNL